MPGVPLVSVLMCVHNAGPYLAAAVDSILTQTFADFEFVLIDDGSTDESSRLLQEYAARDRRIQLHRQANMGLTRSLNRGLDLVRGQYVARMDADDVSQPNRFERQVEFLQQNPEVGVCGTWVELIGTSSGKVWKYPTEPDDVAAAMLFFPPPLAHPTVMMRAAALTRHGLRYDPSFPRGQDFDLWSRCACFFPLANLAEPLLQYRVHAEQVTARFAAGQTEITRRVHQGQFCRLHIELTPAENDLHRALCWNDCQASREFVRAAGRWLHKLHRANRRHRVYPEDAFARLLGNKWLHVCREAVSLGPWVWQHFRRGSLSSWAELDWLDRCKITLRAALPPSWDRARVLRSLTLKMGRVSSRHPSRANGSPLALGTPMKLPSQLRCPTHLSPLVNEGPEVLVCPSHCRFQVVRGIPRFVEADNYANSFGLQWNVFRTTQLDSHTRVPISRERLTRCLGGSLDVVRGKDVLEAGCGAGRFTEVLLEAGARVFALDLSSSVEANRANCGHFDDYFVCQANILEMPIAPRSFDFVLCLGVIQHTPNPEQTIAALAEAVRPGGRLVLDHYHPSDFDNFSRRALRWLMLRLGPRRAYRLNHALCRLLIPVHRWLRPPYRLRGLGRLRNLLHRCSPVIDHYRYLPQLPPETAEAWMELDTHDYLTDYYKHKRTYSQIHACLEGCGLVDVRTWLGGNGVEAQARRAEEGQVSFG